LRISDAGTIGIRYVEVRVWIQSKTSRIIDERKSEKMK
jgi:hypothetical protein